MSKSKLLIYYANEGDVCYSCGKKLKQDEVCGQTNNDDAVCKTCVNKYGII